MFDLVQGLFDLIPALSLCLAVFGDASAAQANLGAPASVFPFVDAAFVVASPFRHVHSSFL